MARHYESWEENIRMKNISVNLFPYQIKALEKVIYAGYSQGRSALIRRIIDQYLQGFVKRMKAFELLTPEQIKIMGE